MSQFEDLTKIKVKQAIACGVDAQRIQRLRSSGEEAEAANQRSWFIARLLEAIRIRTPGRGLDRIFDAEERAPKSA
jgi:hypothetical protein